MDIRVGMQPFDPTAVMSVAAVHDLKARTIYRRCDCPAEAMMGAFYIVAAMSRRAGTTNLPRFSSITKKHLHFLGTNKCCPYVLVSRGYGNQCSLCLFVLRV
jgi:hypothetical protein